MAAVQVAMMAGLPYTALRAGIFAHPTVAEGLTFLLAGMPWRRLSDPRGRPNTAAPRSWRSG